MLSNKQRKIIGWLLLTPFIVFAFTYDLDTMLFLLSSAILFTAVGLILS